MIRFYQLKDMLAKMAANEIRTHACTNRRCTLDRGCGNPGMQNSFRYSAIAAMW